eukprot:gene5019-8748_t
MSVESMSYSSTIPHTSTQLGIEPSTSDCTVPSSQPLHRILRRICKGVHKFLQDGVLGRRCTSVGNCSCLQGNDEADTCCCATAEESGPEAVGVVSGVVYLVVLFLYIPFYLDSFFLDRVSKEEFPHQQFVEFVCAILSICCMIFLGFADDVLNLAWRHKLWLPTVASLPLLMVYYVNDGSTWVSLPPFVQSYLGYATINLGFLFYLYMSMLAVFCTNAINIMAGVNGVEAGQSLVIAISLVLLNIYLSILPFCGVTAGLLRFNWYPSEIFVGDTFCYFAGTPDLSDVVVIFSASNFEFSSQHTTIIQDHPLSQTPINSKTCLLEPSIVSIPRKLYTTLPRAIIFLFRLFNLRQYPDIDSSSQSDVNGLQDMV